MCAGQEQLCVKHKHTKLPMTDNTKTTPEGSSEKVKRFNLKYMQNPPRIMPNYGNRSNRRSPIPKSNVSRVLLYDNVTQQQMLDIKLKHIQIQQKRNGRLLDMHKKSFLLRQKIKHKNMEELVDNTNSFLPSLRSSDRVKSSSANSCSERTDVGLTTLNIRPSTITVSENIRNLKLPTIEANGRKRHVVFRITDVSGFTQVFHTFDDGELFHDLFPVHSIYDQTTQDPRFQGLQEILVPCKTSRDGYLELSPSYHEKRQIPRLTEERADFSSGPDSVCSVDT